MPSYWPKIVAVGYARTLLAPFLDQGESLGQLVCCQYVSDRELHGYTCVKKSGVNLAEVILERREITGVNICGSKQEIRYFLTHGLEFVSEIGNTFLVCFSDQLCLGLLRVAEIHMFQHTLGEVSGSTPAGPIPSTSVSGLWR